MKNLAIIPARSGSKGLKDKNIKSLCGVPLLAYSIRAAIMSQVFSEIMVSTDSDNYAAIAKEYNANVPFLRKDDLSGDFVGSWDVVEEVLKQYKNLGYTFDTVCLLQPTSPLRNANDIKCAYDYYEHKDAEAVTSVCEVSCLPCLTMTLPKDNSLTEFRKEFKSGKPRQLMDNYYCLNGAIYIRKLEYVKNEIRILDSKEYAFLMSKENSIDIDTQDDFDYAEFLIQKRKGTVYE